jgi:hypothetical protein
MKLSALMSVNAVIAGVFGLALIFVPTEFLSVYGVTTDAQFAFVGQLFGAALFGYGLLTWFARNAADSEARRAIVRALFTADAVGFIIALMAQLRGLVNAFGWSTVIIYLLLALGFGYFQFKKPTTTAA